MAWAQTDAGRLYYQVDAPRDPPDSVETILFCHGVATNCDIWAGWSQVLRSRFQVVRFDTRGFGRSAPARQGVPWSMDRLADDIMAVASAAGVSRFHLVGESLGGTVSLYLATRATAPLITLTVASAAYRGDRIGEVGKWSAAVDEAGMAAWSRRMMDQRFVGGALEPAAWRWFETVQTATEPDALLGAAKLLVGVDLTAVLARIWLPVLVINSDGSPYVTPTLAADLHARLPDAEFCVVPNTRHGVVFSHAAHCAELLCRFIARHAASSNRAPDGPGLPAT